MAQRYLIIFLLVSAASIAGYVTFTQKNAATNSPVAAEDDHGHGHEKEEDPNQIVLSDQARQNLNLEIKPIEKSNFWRSIVVPGTITEQPGHSERRITTNVDGIISRVFVLPGQSVRPGEDLVEIQTTGELLANAQSTLLKTLQELELVDIEMKRLEPLADQGSIPGSRVLEKKYEMQRLETQRLVQIQELLVRGLSPDQIRNIMETRTLLRTFRIQVPQDDQSTDTLGSHQESIDQVLKAAHSNVTQPSEPASDMVYTVEELSVFPGKLIQPGDELCGLAIHTHLRIVGMAFQKEAELINRTIEEQRPVTAIFESINGQTMQRENLKVQYADNVVDPETRLLRFYMPLENEVIRDIENYDGRTFRAWKFKPGQRMQLRIPVEHWSNCIVLPINAVVREGAESYVFRENGKLLERVPVTLLYEDTRSAVIADDGSLFDEDPVAMNEAYQLNLALRKAQGGGVDMHAGHSH